MSSLRVTTVLLPPAKGRSIGGDSRPSHQNWGKFAAHNWGEFNGRSQDQQMRGAITA